MKDKLTNRVLKILESFAKGFAAKEKDDFDRLGYHWWGHDTDLGNMESWFNKYATQVTKATKQEYKEEVKKMIEEMKKTEKWRLYGLAREELIDDIIDKLENL